MIQIVTRNAEETIKRAALHTKQDLFINVQDADLIAREFKYHRFCYVNFTDGFWDVTCLQDISQNTTLEEEVEVVTNFEIVKDFISKNILEMHQAVSMQTLVNLYGGGNDHRYRGKLKEWIKLGFPGLLIFIQPAANIPEVVISKDTTLIDPLLDKNVYIARAAEYLRHDILEFSKNLEEVSWPPTAEELLSTERNPPSSVMKFLQQLL